MKKIFVEKKMQELRVLHVSSALSWRGGEQQVAYLVEELRQQDVSQWVLCAKGSEMEKWCRQAGVAFFTYQKWTSFNPLAGWRIRQACIATGATIVHTHDSHGHTYAVLAASLFGNQAPLVIHRRVDFPIGKGWLSKWKYNHPAVARFICISQVIYDMVAAGVKDPSILELVNSGIDLGKFGLDETGKGLQKSKTPGSILRKEFKVPDGRYIVANVAAIAPHKDYFTFVKTAEILIRERFPAWFFVIGADGGEEQAIRHFIRQKNLEEYFVFTGFRNDIPQILPEVDVLLFTSKTEGLGGAIFEAMACGVPIVATAAGGVPEIVEHGISSLLAPVGDAAILARQVRQVLDEPGLKTKLAENAFKRLPQFSKKKMAREVMDVYKKCQVHFPSASK
ncbi:MAG: glycosyltransferase family 4 protein [Saprospiraceae bacterium]